MLSEDSVAEIKQKLIAHIDSTFPKEKARTAKQQVESMSSDELETFLEKNHLIRNEEEPKQNCVFCSIANESIKSVKIGENEKAIAALDINPVSKGQCLIIPREHTDNSPEAAIQLAEEISAKLKEKFKPKKVEVSKSKLFGHEVISLLPVYDEESFNSEKKPAELNYLEEIKAEMEKQEEPEEKKESLIEQVKEFLRLPKRIP